MPTQGSHSESSPEGKDSLRRLPAAGHWKPAIEATLLFLVDETSQQVLLIRKKRGLGAGKINGPGGKMETGETGEACARRETQEELGIAVSDPVLHGQLWFQFADGLALYAEVFRATCWQGQPVETDEALPLWTPLDELPFAEMWADDELWLGPMLLDRRCFLGRFLFDGDCMLDHRLDWLPEAPPTPPWRVAND